MSQSLVNLKPGTWPKIVSAENNLFYHDTVNTKDPYEVMVVAANCVDENDNDVTIHAQVMTDGAEIMVFRANGGIKFDAKDDRNYTLDGWVLDRYTKFPNDPAFPFGITDFCLNTGAAQGRLVSETPRKHPTTLPQHIKDFFGRMVSACDEEKEAKRVDEGKLIEERKKDPEIMKHRNILVSKIKTSCAAMISEKRKELKNKFESEYAAFMAHHQKCAEEEIKTVKEAYKTAMATPGQFKYPTFNSQYAKFDNKRRRGTLVHPNELARIKAEANDGAGANDGTSGGANDGTGGPSGGANDGTGGPSGGANDGTGGPSGGKSSGAYDSDSDPYGLGQDDPKDADWTEQSERRSYRCARYYGRRTTPRNSGVKTAARAIRQRRFKQEDCNGAAADNTSTDNTGAAADNTSTDNTNNTSTNDTSTNTSTNDTGAASNEAPPPVCRPTADTDDTVDLTQDD